VAVEDPTVSSSRVRVLRRLGAGLFAAFLLTGLPTVGAAAANFSNMGDSNDPKALRSIAFKSYLDKNPDEALVFYQKAVNSAIKTYGADSTFVADLYYEMGALSLESGKFVTAENWLQKAVAQNPNSVMARVKLAELLQVREKHTEALAQIQAALKKNPRSLEARHALVLWLIDRKNSAAAIKEAYALEQLSKPGAAKSDLATRLAITNIPTPSMPQQAKAAAEQKPKAEPPAKPAQLPVLSFLRGAQKKPAAAPAAEPKPQPKPIAPPPKPAAAKHVEAPKPAKTAETKHNKHKTKEKEHAAAHKAAPAPEPAAEPVTALKAVPESLSSTLKTTAKQVKASAKPAPAAKPQPSENETPESAPVEQPAPVAVTPPPPMRIESHKGHPKAGLVPPPPPTVYFPPPQMLQSPRAKPVAAKPKPKEPPKEAKETPSEPAEKPAATGGNSDDASFMLQWADVKRKPKPGSK
jgi:tetratricopeptide (TPR) repeat protein